MPSLLICQDGNNLCIVTSDVNDDPQLKNIVDRLLESEDNIVIIV